MRRSARRSRTATTGFFKEFLDFALKGNVVDLALAVIIGGAFGRIITSFVEDVVMPLINPLIPGGNWRELTLAPGVRIGSFLGSVVDFLVIALVLFVAIRGLTKFKRTAPAPATPSDRECPYCLERVPVAASRCRACTSELPLQ